MAKNSNANFALATTSWTSIAVKDKLIIELDGGQHAMENKRTYDLEREAYLKKAGFRILRFWNNEVDENIDGVLEKILQTISH